MVFFILVGVLIILLLLSLPVAFSLIFTSFTLVMVEETADVIIMAQRLVNDLYSFPLLAVPLFILTAKVMNDSGATNQIFEFAKLLVGNIPGGFGHVNIIASMIFSGMSGSATADASGLGQIEIKAMNDKGYPKPLAAAITAASATIGPILPPSIAMVIYGALSGASISALFMGGAVPGILMGLSMMAVVYYKAKKTGFDKDVVKTERPGFKESVKITLKSLPALFLIVIILGGIWGGIFSPTEAASVAVAYALFLGLFFYKELEFSNLPKMLLEASKLTATIMIIVAGANLYGWLVSAERIPLLLEDILLGFTDSRILLLLVINIAFLFIGMFMELIAVVTIAVPVILPILLQAGIDPMYFGVLAIFNLMIGLLTPPFGINIFIIQEISGVPFGKIVSEAIPFMVILGVVLLLMIFFPEIVTFLPEVLLY